MDSYRYINDVLHKKCSACCVVKKINHYKNDRNRELKTCFNCRDRSKKYQLKIKLIKEEKLKEAEKKLLLKENKQPFNSVKRFINELLKYREDNKEHDKKSDDWRLQKLINSSKLYEKYNKWRFDNAGEHQTHNKFARSIYDLLPNKKRTSKGNIYILP